MKRVIRRYELTDEEWERIKKYFPERQPGTLGRPRKEPRDMLNGIFWIARSGASWRDLSTSMAPRRFYSSLVPERNGHMNEILY